jgi:hypothetical protein
LENDRKSRDNPYTGFKSILTEGNEANGVLEPTFVSLFASVEIQAPIFDLLSSISSSLQLAAFQLSTP